MSSGIAGDPLEVVTQLRSAAIALGTDHSSGFDAPSGPLRGAHVRAARGELERLGRATFLAERWATQPVVARTRIVWRSWAQSFVASLKWEATGSSRVSPRMRERLDELNCLLSGPATRGELRVLQSYEEYFQSLFTLGWAIVARADPLGDERRLPGAGTTGDAESARVAWTEVVGAWTAPWEGRRRHDRLLGSLLAWIESGSTATASLQTGGQADENPDH